MTDTLPIKQPQEVPVPPTTTTQEDLVTAGQRKVNLIWEYTQSAVTILVVLANMVVATYHGLNVSNAGVVDSHPVILSSALFLILGFYYSRTNHTSIGGVGAQPFQPYEGR